MVVKTSGSIVYILDCFARTALELTSGVEDEAWRRSEISEAVELADLEYRRNVGTFSFLPFSS